MLFITKHNEKFFTKQRAEPTSGKAKRMAKMFDISRRIDNAIKLPQKPKKSRIDLAINGVSMREVKLIDIGNYLCNQGKTTVNTVRAKQKLRLGHRDLV